ncbi:uncharacterized protein VTP21DRAFT_133 [Calcarisporiella thermophila]|uniref:uncharacterized protein n=1 Tax=Calcarisporiella thermophila TaxID=911321 RepID=UPI0037442EE6
MTSLSLRPLGYLEKYQVSKQLVDVYGTVALTIRIHDAELSSFRAFTEREQYLRSRFYPILRSLCSEFAHLTIGVIDLDTPTPRFAGLKEIDLSRVISAREIPFTDPCKLSSYLEAEKREIFDLSDLTMPLWRIRILLDPICPADFVLSFSFDHVIADGLSSLALCQRLLAISSAIKPSTEMSPLFHPTHPTTLPSPLNDRVSLKPGVLDLFPILIRSKFLPSYIKRWLSPPFWAGHVPARREPHCTRCLVFSVPRDPFNRLCDRAKKERTTPHAALYVACLLGLLETLEAFSSKYPQQSPPITFRSNTVVSARNYLNPPLASRELGNFVGSVSIDKTFSTFSTAPLYSRFWPECRDYKQMVEHLRPSAIKETGLLAYLGRFPDNWIQFWVDPLESKGDASMGRRASFEISDLGRAKFEQGEWNVVEGWFSQSVQVTGATLYLNFVSIAEGLGGTLTWQEGSCDEAFLRAFITRYTEILEEVVAIA